MRNMQKLDVTKLKEFENHPYKVKHDDEMEMLIESIKEHGILSPIIVRPLTESETEIAEAEQDNIDLKHFLKTIRACTDLKELTPEIVNTLIKRINVHNAEKVHGHTTVKIDIVFIAVGLISIPDEKELLTLMEEIRNEKVA